VSGPIPLPSRPVLQGTHDLIPYRVSSMIRAGGMTTDGSPFIARRTAKTVPEALQAVTTALERHRFAVLYHLDVNEKLAEKGLSAVPPFHILEVCSAPRAKQALETNPSAGYFLPCKVVVFRDPEGDGTVIGLQRPHVMLDLVGDDRLKPLADDVEAVLTQVIDDAAQG
jgi:uncharacterized protein (DUF302 family)